MARRTSLDRFATQRNQAERQFKSLNERFKGMSEQQKMQNPEYVSARTQYHQSLSGFNKRFDKKQAKVTGVKGYKSVL
jgi:hypothetical protein